VGALEAERKRRERRQEAEGLGAEDEERQVLLPTPSFMASAEEELEVWGQIFLCLSFVFSFVISFAMFLGALYYSWDRPGRRAKGSLQRAAFPRTAFISP
jgi:hypothetical protein